jgi:MFS family permease
MGYVIKRVGRRIPIIFGCYCVALSLQILAFINYLESRPLFLFLTFVARIMQGIGFTLIQVTCLSIAATFYPLHREWLIGMLEASIGAGQMIGPLIGTALFYMGGYVFMLSSLGGIFFTIALFFPTILPKFLD